MQEIFVGVDVAKDWLDIHHPGRGARRIENTPKAVRTFARSSARQGDWIIFEASGGYDRLLREALEGAAVRFTRVNPRQARDFARAMGVIGKTDRVDARTLGTRCPPPASADLAAGGVAARPPSASEGSPPARGNAQARVHKTATNRRH